MKSDKVLPISIVIPTLNEEDLLPRLLMSIKKQEWQPLEVIVADADSEDRTQEIARAHDAKVVKGGTISTGRNNGAQAAQGKVIFFFDADTILPDPIFLKRTYDLWIESDGEVGSTLFTLDKESRTSISASIVFSFYSLLKIISANLKQPFLESGFFLIANNDSFQKINGFREMTPGIPEDIDLMLRSIKAGLNYRVVPTKIYTSGRRYKKFIPSIRSILGAVIGGFAVKRDLIHNEKLVRATTKLYGKLGGKHPEKKKHEEEIHKLTQDRSAFFLGQKNTMKLTISAAILGIASIVGAGLVIATRMKGKADKKKSHEDTSRRN